MHPKLVANNGVFFHSIIYCFQSWEGKHTVAVADLSATATVSNEMAFFSGPRLNRPFLATFTTTPVNSKHGKMPKLPTSFYLDIVTTSVLTSNSNKNSRPKRFQHALNYSNFYHDSAVQSWGTFKSGRQAEALLPCEIWSFDSWKFSFVDFFVSNRFFSIYHDSWFGMDQHLPSLEGVACFASFDVMVNGSQVVKEGLFLTSPASDVRSSRNGKRLH